MPNVEGFPGTFHVSQSTEQEDIGVRHCILQLTNEFHHILMGFHIQDDEVGLILLDGIVIVFIRHGRGRDMREGCLQAGKEKVIGTDNVRLN